MLQRNSEILDYMAFSTTETNKQMLWGQAYKNKTALGEMKWLSWSKELKRKWVWKNIWQFMGENIKPLVKSR